MPIDEKFKHSVNSLYLETRHTHGHSEGGMTYLIKGLERPVAIVGDAIFAGSIGGGMVSYDDALRTNKEKILSLSEDTILCPGHGPMTTISEEKANNPFFPIFPNFSVLVSENLQDYSACTSQLLRLQI